MTRTFEKYGAFVDKFAANEEIISEPAHFYQFEILTYSLTIVKVNNEDFVVSPNCILNFTNTDISSVKFTRPDTEAFITYQK